MLLKPWNEDYASLFLLPHPFWRYVRVPGQMATFTLGKHTFIPDNISISWHHELLLWQLLLWWSGLSIWGPGLWLWLWWLQRPRVWLERLQIRLLPPIVLWRIWIFRLLLKMKKTGVLGLKNSNITLLLILLSLSISNEIQMPLWPSGHMYSEKDQSSHWNPEIDQRQHFIPSIDWEFYRLSPVASLWPIFNKAIFVYVISY